MNHVQHVSQANFSKEVLQSAVPVLIDFYADWCGPCRMLAPSLERLAAEFSGRAKIVKINIDAEPELANQFEVQSIPTLAAMSHGRLVGKTAGFIPEASLRQALNQLTGNAAATDRRVG